MSTNQSTVDRTRGLEALSKAEPTIPRARFPWRTRVALPLLVVSSMMALLAYAARDSILPAKPVHVVRVVLKSGSGQVDTAQATVQSSGWVEADPYPVAVAALSDGVVREVLVLEGQSVTKGQIVARLVEDDARLALARADAELADRQAELIAAQKQWDNPVERVRALDFAAGAVAETEADLRRLDAEIAVESAKADELADQLARAEQAFESRASSELEVVGTRLKLQAQRATVEATRAKRGVLEGQLKQKRADLVAATENRKLRIEEEQQLAAAKAAVALATAMRDEARLRLDRMEIRSPVDGVVMERLIEPGSKLVQTLDDPHSGHAVRLFDPKHLQVRVDVPLADAAKVGVGMDAKIVVGVLPDRTFDGKVTRIVQQADLSKNTLQVKVAIVNPATELKPEMLARVRFIPASSQDAGGARASQVVFAPEKLLTRMGDHFSVWVLNPSDSTAQLRMVRTGVDRHDGWVAVVSGLNAGDSIITETDDLSEGARVRVLGEADAGKEVGNAVH